MFLTKEFISIYEDSNNSRYSIVTHEESNELYFCYHKEYTSKNIKFWPVKKSLSLNFSLYDVESKDGCASRGLKILSVVESGSQEDSTESIAYIYGENVSQDFLIENIKNNENKILVFVRCDFSNIDINSDHLKTIKNDIAFFDCSFKENFFLIGLLFKKNLWIVNSCFDKLFSLKGSKINKSVHLEGSTFGFKSNVSFRGLEAVGLYLDLGVVSNSEMGAIVFAEMNVSGAVFLSGNYLSRIKVSDNKDCNNIINEFNVGMELIHHDLNEPKFLSEDANITRIENYLTIETANICHFFIDKSKLFYIKIADSIVNTIEIKNCNIEQDLILENCVSFPSTLSVLNTNISRHLEMSKVTFSGVLNFKNSFINGATSWSDCDFSCASGIILEKFVSGRLLPTPASIFSVEKNDLNPFFPKNLDFIKDPSDKSLKYDQYCSLKKWFSDSGHLDMEDVAYFHMRHVGANFFEKFFFGVLFGWGVRLVNILITSFFFIALFSLIFWFSDENLSFLHSVSLSVQSFISSFFGEWGGFNYSPTSYIVTLVTIESFLGVILITTLIGAYIRKLLR